MKNQSLIIQNLIWMDFKPALVPKIYNSNKNSSQKRSGKPKRVHHNIAHFGRKYITKLGVNELSNRLFKNCNIDHLNSILSSN